MKPATTAKRTFEKTKLLIVDAGRASPVSHGAVADLATILRRGDLLVVNVASTLPSSFHGKVRRSREDIEVRLAAFIGESSSDLRRWSAVVFDGDGDGDGDWRQPTERRGPAPGLVEGDLIDFSSNLSLKVLRVDSHSSRLVQIEFISENLVHALFLEGRPIQYSYHEKELAVWDQQTLFHGPPVSVEPPSAAFPLTWNLVLKLRELGVAIATIVHSAGISSTGDVELDARLPLAEYYEVPNETLSEIELTRSLGGRVVALGTSVTRAIESSLATGRRTGLTTLKLNESSQIRGVDILVTGMHEEGSSHAELMKAFADGDTLKAAEREADRNGYRSHEFGDLTLLLRRKKV